MQVIKMMAIKPMKQYGETLSKINQVIELDVQNDFNGKKG